MKFEQALKCMREGKKVKRSHWCFPLTYDSELEFFFLIDHYGCEKTYYLDHCDIVAEDWEVVDE